MRALLEAIVPERVLRLARESKDFLCLSALPRRRFNTANLHNTREDQIARLLGDQEPERGWQRDHTAIVDLFPDDDLVGGICPGERRALYYLVRGLKPQNVLEIGTHVGASTVYIARALASNGSGRLTTVDIVDVNDRWQRTGALMAPRELVARLNCSSVDFVVSSSVKFLRRTKQRFDLIFLDGDHRSQTVYAEVALALDVLAPQGIVLLHDYCPGGKGVWPLDPPIRGPYRALRRITRENSSLVLEPFGRLPWPTKQGVHFTSLAWLSRKDFQASTR